MGLLADVFSYGDTLKRRLGGLLSDPAGTVDLGVRRFAEDQNSLLQLMDQSGYTPGAQSVLQTPQDKAQARNELAKKALETYGGLLGVVRPDVAKTLNITRQLPKDEAFASAVSNTPGAMVTDEGLLMKLQRNQRPEQGMQPSVRGGVFYLPEGAAQAKHYSTGKNGYGGAERISGETLLANPLLAKGGTGGKAPQAAYDQLVGKGAYEQMRNEALKAYGSYGSGGASRVPLVRDFLSKHAPELVDQAENIVRNSGQGNQLAYALQEAAVGSAVRKAGHDAVLGYSKGKSGPFLSEVFDVRESHYPDAFGGSRIWDSLKN